ncbi:MAG: hypothetical protein AABW68_05260, partial [archaeon]
MTPTPVTGVASRTRVPLPSFRPTLRGTMNRALRSNAQLANMEFTRTFLPRWERKILKATDKIGKREVRAAKLESKKARIQTKIAEKDRRKPIGIKLF